MPIQHYLNQIAQYLTNGDATEHTYRPALQQLLNTLLPQYRVTNERRRLECGAPDFEIAQGVVPLGYIETKDIGADLDKVQASEQLQRYFRSLDNVILTDYLEFRWFVYAAEQNAYQVKHNVRLASVVNRQLQPHPQAFAQLPQLFKNFTEAQAITLRTPEQLAAKMAYLAEQINRSILQGYQNEDRDGKLHSQLESFRSVLIDTLRPEEFADMVAQTVCYGLFAAKCSAIYLHAQPLNSIFSRLNAIYFVPKTNPFLRQLFSQLAGVD